MTCRTENITCHFDKIFSDNSGESLGNTGSKRTMITFDKIENETPIMYTI